MLKKLCPTCALGIVAALASCTFTCSSVGQTPSRPPNDDFADAILWQGNSPTATTAFSGATVELGEPAHLDGQSCKSLWWRWQAPVNGNATIWSFDSFATNVVFAVYTGPSVEALSLTAKGTGRVDFFAVGGTIYSIAAVVNAEASGDIGVSGSIRGTAGSIPVPGNLLCEGSFEGTFLSFQCWHAAPGYGGWVNEGGGADGVTWIHVGQITWLFGLSSFADAPALIQKLTTHSDPVSQYLWDQFQPWEQATLADPNRSIMTKTPIVNIVFNNVISDGLIYDPTRFAGVPLSPLTVELLGRNPGGNELVHLNRLLLEDAYPTEIVKAYVPDQWRSLGQEFSTVSGRNYQVRFAFSGANAQVRVWWNDQELGVAQIPEDEGGFWHWATFEATATSTNSRIAVENLGAYVSLDAFSVIWLNEPPAIVTPPISVNTIVGGTASFLIGVSGSAPLFYQWYFNGTPLAGKTRNVLQFESVGVSSAGEYFVVVTNGFGAVTSPPVSLTVEAPTSPTVVLQPYGDRVIAGGYFALSVLALGPPPLQYQWFFEGNEIAGETNRQLVFAPIDLTNAGVYTVKVWNEAETVWSLPAALLVDTNVNGGGLVYLANRYLQGMSTNEAPVFDVDGVTRLSGSNFVAQLYAGRSVAELRAVGTPTPFYTGFMAGFFRAQPIALPNVPPETEMVVQVRVWQRSDGASYEEARALGGKFGRSALIQTVAATPPYVPPSLPGLVSFTLQAGLPQFTVGRIDAADRNHEGGILWSLTGAADCRYLVEKTEADLVWRPLQVITNLTGVVTFTDPSPPSSSEVFYRARILE